MRLIIYVSCLLFISVTASAKAKFSCDPVKTLNNLKITLAKKFCHKHYFELLNTGSTDTDSNCTSLYHDLLDGGMKLTGGAIAAKILNGNNIANTKKNRTLYQKRLTKVNDKIAKLQAKIPITAEIPEIKLSELKLNTNNKANFSAETKKALKYLSKKEIDKARKLFLEKLDLENTLALMKAHPNNDIRRVNAKKDRIPGKTPGNLGLNSVHVENYSIKGPNIVKGKVISSAIKIGVGAIALVAAAPAVVAALAVYEAADLARTTEKHACLDLPQNRYADYGEDGDCNKINKSIGPRAIAFLNMTDREKIALLKDNFFLCKDYQDLTKNILNTLEPTGVIVSKCNNKNTPSEFSLTWSNGTVDHVKIDNNSDYKVESVNSEKQKKYYSMDNALGASTKIHLQNSGIIYPKSSRTKSTSYARRKQRSFTVSDREHLARMPYYIENYLKQNARKCNIFSKGQQRLFKKNSQQRSSN